MIYANENNGFWPPAHIDFLLEEQRPLARHAAGQSIAAFDFETSPMRKQLGTARLRACPSFDFVEGSVGFERSNGGYGYNAAFLGSSLGVPANWRASRCRWLEYERRVVNVPAKAAKIHRPAEKIAFTDAAIANPAVDRIQLRRAAARQPTATRRRHRFTFATDDQANVAWADGHGTCRTLRAGPIRRTSTARQTIASDLGFFGPHDNALFRARLISPFSRRACSPLSVRKRRAGSPAKRGCDAGHVRACVSYAAVTLHLRSRRLDCRIREGLTQ